MKPLAIIPSYPTKIGDLVLLEDCIKSLRESEGDRLDILVVDDGSPDEHLRVVTGKLTDKYDADLHLKEENSGFSQTVNVGLQRALDEGRDAILVNADIEIPLRGRGAERRKFLDAMLTQERLHGDGLASVVGALLTFPNGLIQHAGVYFSLITRQFDHRFKYAPANLHEAQVPTTCPVTAAFALIRHECLEHVGIYDPDFRMGWEDMDYAIRVFLSDRECVYQPKVRAIHHESVFRSAPTEKLQRWQFQSYVRLMRKWEHQSFAGLVPEL